MPNGNFHVQIYSAPRLFRKSQLRWRAVSGSSPSKGNHEILASGEAYHNKQDLLQTVWLLFGHDVTIYHLAGSGK